MTEVVVIMGPTASGKSALALEWAEKRGGEIVSVDSMQVYRGLEIGTAQPTAEERERVPHHLVGFMDIGERIDVFGFCRLADAAIADIAGRGSSRSSRAAPVFICVRCSTASTICRAIAPFGRSWTRCMIPTPAKLRCTSACANWIPPRWRSSKSAAAG